jgi:hypothetical protein
VREKRSVISYQLSEVRAAEHWEPRRAHLIADN